MSAITRPRHIEHSIWASFWRGGTSKGVFIHENSLPFKLAHDGTGYRYEGNERLRSLLATIMGSPDPHYGRQLNGLGGGISSLSKAVIYRAPVDPSDSEADIEYTFVQVGIADGKLDLSGNCGNLTSVLGPLAFNHGLVRSLPLPGSSQARGGEGREEERREEVTVRLRNLNTSKIIRAVITTKCTTTPPHSPLGQRWIFDPDGDYAIDGVSGTASKILLQFTNPGGAKTGKTLPTGNVVDCIVINETSEAGSLRVNASLVDVTNPGIFVDGRDFRHLGWTPDATPAKLNSNTTLMKALEQIRRRGTEMMGLDPDENQAVPKIVLVYPPSSSPTTTTASSSSLASDTDNVDISCHALSMQTVHKAVPGTLALNLGASCQIPGTIPHQLVSWRQKNHRKDKATVVIGHPSGKAHIGATVNENTGVVESVELGRTARCLMEGFVPIPSDPTTHS